MDIVSIVSLIVSTIGVIVSLYFFNASIDNSRKVLLNKLLTSISYDVCWMFSVLEKDERKISEHGKFKETMLAIDSLLNQIEYNSKQPIPSIGFSLKYEENKVVNTLHMRKGYENISKYFSLRNIKNFDLLVEEYDDRLYFHQHYRRVYRYIRKICFGPIIGVKVIYKRTNLSATYGSKQTKISVKTIRNLNDLKKYYEETFLHFSFIEPDSKVAFERDIHDIVFQTVKGKEMPITIYRQPPIV
jgi:hypothetical protein